MSRRKRKAAESQADARGVLKVLDFHYRGKLVCRVECHQNGPRVLKGEAWGDGPGRMKAAAELRQRWPGEFEDHEAAWQFLFASVRPSSACV